VISRQFVAPNFVVEASEEDGKRWKWVTRGSSKEDVVVRLEEEEWIVHTVEPYDFQGWLQQSASLLQGVQHPQGNAHELDFDAKHYGKLKHHLFELFEGKCAYCEGEGAHVASGDVEHFRPKRGVKGEPDHPGYYWLAYDVQNLLPSCERCNRAGAKMNHFPVEAGTRATAPEEVEDERPLLLNPYLDRNPLEHLKFLKSGKVVGRTEKGDRSIGIYRLQRRELKRKREEKIGEAERELNVAITHKGLDRAISDLIEELKLGRREYSAALLSVLADWLEQQQNGIARALRRLRSDGAE
jgi:uncharacterized protein (TIGR02646 family)